jgi:polyisoprenyl-teichoic acid--peptidoglycan teichoic acid transferase
MQNGPAKPVIYRAQGKRKVRWKRIVIAVISALIVIALIAGGSFYLWFRHQVGEANARVSQDVLNALHETTTTVAGSTASSGGDTTGSTLEPPTGMNIVLLGSDTRASSGGGGRSDSIIMVHIDSTKNYLSMLSIPRDLRVEIPGHGFNKINASYQFGGPALVIRTLKSVFNVKIDHYMEIDFNAFKEMTEQLGGVWIDVDRVYDDGLIQFQPGYQSLIGSDALRYVRTRHDTNFDFGRMERQQRFINALREQAMGWNLPLKLPGLISALFSNVDTDLTANEFLKLAYWGVKLDGGRMRQAKITGATQTIDGTSFVIADNTAIQNAVKDFFTEPSPVKEETVNAPASATLAQADLSGVSVNVVNSTGRPGQGGLAAVWLMRQGAKVISIKESDDPVTGAAEVTYPASKADAAEQVATALGIGTAKQSGKSSTIMVTLGTAWGITGDQIPAATVTTTSASGIVDQDHWGSLAAKTSLKLLAPTFIPANCVYAYQRDYSIKVGDKQYPAVRVGYQYMGKDKYMGISATTWTQAPIASPGYRVKGPGGVIYRMVGSATKCDHVWWVSNGVLYWVSNSLVYDLRREELLAEAMSALPAAPGASVAEPTSTTEAGVTTSLDPGDADTTTTVGG